MINSNEIVTETINIYYFESGHTFMSADSFHNQVEEAMKKEKNIFDFTDFENAVREANAQVVIKSMIHSDFSDWKDYTSSSSKKSKESRPNLHSIKHIQEKRGKTSLLYKVTYELNEEFKILNFLQSKIVKAGIPKPAQREVPRGIQKKKKIDIIKKLLPLMPLNRQMYWQNLPESDVCDLTDEYED